MFVFTSWLVSHEEVCIHIQYLFGVRRNKLPKQPLEIFCKKVFLKIPKNLQENTCARDSFLIKM